MNTKSSILLAGLLSLSPIVAFGQNAPEPEIISRGASYSIVKTPSEPDPELLAEMTPEEQEAYLNEENFGTYTVLGNGLN